MIGLNSQGVSRRAVAIDMVKKFATFFGSGGASMSWFDLLYPDPDAKIAGSNGESFNVFDARYLAYNPKITAISDYDLINALTVKKFVGPGAIWRCARVSFPRQGPAQPPGHLEGCGA